MPHSDRIDRPVLADEEIDIPELIRVIGRRKKLIITIVLLGIALSAAVSFLLPDMYTATARILPPKETGPGLSSLLTQTAGPLAGLAGSLLQDGSDAKLYKGILESRTVADALIRNFDLKESYNKRYMADVYSVLTKRTQIEISKDSGVINISVEDGDPDRSAAMANTYVEELDQINQTVNMTAAKRKRGFLEKRLDKVKNDLIVAETNLKQFQETHRLVSIDDQARAAIEGAAKIKGEIISAQTELEVMKEFGTERQNKAVMLKSRIRELENQLGKIVKGNPDGGSLYIPFNELPALGLDLARHMREAKIQEELFQLITTQHELAKIEEAKDMNTIQVLDRAIPPDKKSGPPRTLIIILVSTAALFGSIFMAYYLEYARSAKPAQPEP